MMRLIGFLMLFAALPSAASAQTNRFGLWSVAPSPQIGSTVSFPATYGFMVYGKVIPNRVVVAQEDYLDAATGAVLVKANAQIVSVTPGTGLASRDELYCTFRNLKNSGAAWRSGVDSTRLICFIDRDGDRAFDAYVLCAALEPALLIDGKCPPDRLQLRGGSYRTIDPSDFQTDMVFGLIYTGGAEFGFCIGTPQKCRRLSGVLKAKTLQVPVQTPAADLLLLARGRVSATYKILVPTGDRTISVGRAWRMF